MTDSNIDVNGAETEVESANAVVEAASELPVTEAQTIDTIEGEVVADIEQTDTELRRKSAEQTLAKINEIRLKRAAAQVVVLKAEPERIADAPEPEDIEEESVAIDVAIVESEVSVSENEQPKLCSEPVETTEPEKVLVEVVEESGVEPEENIPWRQERAPSAEPQVVVAPQPIYSCPMASAVVYPPVQAPVPVPEVAQAPARVVSRGEKLNARVSMKKHTDEVTIKDIVSLFIPKLWIIAVCAVVLGIILGGYAMFFKSDTYTSKVTFMVSTTTGSVTDGDLKLSREIIDIIDIHIFSDDFLQDVAATINEKHAEKGWSITAKELKRSISLTKLNEEAPAFTLSITTTSDVKSFDIADTLCSYLVADPVTGGDAPIKSFMQESYYRVTMRKIDSPELGTLNDKGVITNAVIGFLAGAAVSMVIIYMITMFDVVIHDRKKLEDHFDLPILGVVPRYDGAASSDSKGGAAG